MNTLTNCQGKVVSSFCKDALKAEEICISQAVELSVCLLGTEAFDAFKA